MHYVDLGESFPTSIYLQNLASIQPRTSPVKFARPSHAAPGEGDLLAEEVRVRAFQRSFGVEPGGRGQHCAEQQQRDPEPKVDLSWTEILQIFGGLVLGCIKTKFCKKICV